MDPFSALVLIGAVGAGAWWWFRSGRGGLGQTEMRLRQICLGDEGQMEDLIAAELRRAPGITRAEAASRAVLRYERDNR